MTFNLFYTLCAAAAAMDLAFLSVNLSRSNICVRDTEGRHARRQYQKQRRQKASDEIVNYWLWKGHVAGDPVAQYVWHRKMQHCMPKLN